MAEDYTRARTLAAFTYMGEEFRVVRRRINGKPWRKYCMVLHQNTPITHAFIFDTTDAQHFAYLTLEKMRYSLPTRESLQKGLDAIHKGNTNDRNT